MLLIYNEEMEGSWSAISDRQERLQTERDALISDCTKVVKEQRVLFEAIRAGSLKHLRERYVTADAERKFAEDICHLDKTASKKPTRKE